MSNHYPNITLQDAGPTRRFVRNNQVDFSEYLEEFLEAPSVDGRDAEKWRADRWYNVWARQPGTHVPFKDEDRRIVALFQDSTTYDPMQCPQLLKAFSMFYQYEDKDTSAFYAKKWGGTHILAWYESRRQGMRRSATEAGQEMRLADVEYIWITRRESYRVRVVQTFLQAIDQAIGVNSTPDDSMLRYLLFPMDRGKLEIGRRLRERWIKPIVENSVYGDSYLYMPSYIHWSNVLSEMQVPTKRLSREILVYAARSLVADEVSDVLFSVQIAPRLYLDDTLQDAERSIIGKQADWRYGQPWKPWTAKEKCVDGSSMSFPAFVQGYLYGSIIEAVYLMLYGQMIENTYERCPVCGSAFDPWEGREEKIGRKKVYCGDNCCNMASQARSRERKRHQRMRQPNDM